jgi:hypothetical protein
MENKMNKKLNETNIKPMSKIHIDVTHLNGNKTKNVPSKDAINISNVKNEHMNKENEKERKKKRKIYKNKCNCMIDGKICKKKLSMTEEITNKCRCGLVFCSKHKGCLWHICSFDYKNKLFQGNGLGGGQFKQLEVI